LANRGHSGYSGTIGRGKELARDAERLADHEVDQAFSQSLRQASLAQPKLSDKALALQKRVNDLQQTVKNDEARIAALNATVGAKPAATISNNSELEIAKAQLGLDQTELADSIEDLARESGYQRSKLQQELAARQAAMKQYKDRASQDDGQTCLLSGTVPNISSTAINSPQSEAADRAG
jgi:hypothetical protein